MRCTVPLRVVYVRCMAPMTEALLGSGESSPPAVGDDTVMVPGRTGRHSLVTRAYVAIAQGEPEQADETP